jgi:hypothetical protein
VIDLLLERGARHHILSAMALGDLDLVQRLVEENPECLSRRRSHFENAHTPLHAAFAPPDGIGSLSGKPNYTMLELLIELGADVEAKDDKGRTPLAVAMLRGDREAMRRLRAAGANEPQQLHTARVPEDLAAIAGSVKKSVPMFFVLDMRATVRWYESIGFTVDERYEDGGELVFARLSFGNGEFTLSPGGKPGPRDVRLWFFTDRIQELYQLLKQRQLRAAHAALSGGTIDEPEVRFDEDLYEPFYGGRQFSIQDNNGLEPIFWEPEKGIPVIGCSKWFQPEDTAELYTYVVAGLLLRSLNPDALESPVKVITYDYGHSESGATRCGRPDGGCWCDRRAASKFPSRAGRHAEERRGTANQYRHQRVF